MSVDNYKFVHKQQFTTLYGTLSITSALYTTTHSKLWVVCSRIMIQLVTLGITDVSWRQNYCVRNIVICTLLLTQSLGVIQNHVTTSIINGMLGPFYVMENMPPPHSQCLIKAPSTVNPPLRVYTSTKPDFSIYAIMLYICAIHSF